MPWQGKASRSRPERGRRPSAAQPGAAAAHLRSAGVSMGAGLWLGPCVLAVQGRGQSSSLPPALLPSLLLFSPFPLFSSFPLCPARVSFAGSAAPWHVQSFAHLSGQALSTCRGTEGKVDTIRSSTRASFRDASGVYGSCRPVSQPQGSWVLESGSEGLGTLLLSYGASWGFN